MKQSQFTKEKHAAILAIIKQGKPCVSNNRTGVCAYADTEGNNCIVGKMFTPEELAKYGDIQGSVTTLIKEGWREGVYTHKQVCTLHQMQLAHDNWANSNIGVETYYENQRRRFLTYMLYYLYNKAVITNKQYEAYLNIARLPADKLSTITSYKEVPPYTKGVA